MAGFTPMTQAEFAALAATAFASQPGTKPPNTDAGSALGPAFQAAGLIGTFLQNEIAYILSIERMANIPALPGGVPNPDLDSFCAPFGVTRLAASAASGNVTCSTPSPVGSQITVPAGAIIATPNGVQFEIQAGGAGYDSGTGGYDIPTGQSSVVVPVVCLTDGIVGNVVAGTQFTATGGGGSMPPAVNSITNAAPFTNAEPDETDAAFKARFTLTVSSGRVATPNAVIAAALAVQSGMIYSFGDRANLDGTEHDAYFTLVVNLANTGAAAPGSLITEVAAAVEAVRGGGISYQVVGPSIVTVNGSGIITPTPQFVGQQSAVQNAVNAAFTAFVNAIGLNTDTTSTVCSIARCYAALLATTINGVPCVFDVTGLQLNGSAVDISFPFGTQGVAGTANFTAAE